MFVYSPVGPAGNTPLTPSGKDLKCKSFKLDFSVTNGATGSTIDLGVLPKDAQVVGAMFTNPVTVTGPSVTAATMLINVGGYAVYGSGTDIFTARSGLTPTATTYFNNLQNITADQKVQLVLSLTGGATATAGVLYLNLYYVV